MAQEEIRKKVDLAFLAAFYGGMLTPRQRHILALHCEEDLSLGEIADEIGISRQAAHESISRAAAKLNEMETALGVAKRFQDMENGLEAALTALREKRYENAEQLLEGLLRLDREENNGL